MLENPTLWLSEIENRTENIHLYFVHFHVTSYEILGGVNSHRLGYGMCHFLRVHFWQKINFWVYSVYKFLGQVVILE